MWTFHFEECLTDMNSQNARFLELVSTVLYFDNLPKEEVQEKIFTLKSKQRYTIEEVEGAYQYIETLKGKVILKLLSNMGRNFSYILVIRHRLY